MQKTTFPIEIIIHDDASTDGTAKIVKEYADKYPDLIVPILQTENQYSQGIKPSHKFVFPRARGKYIAFCEGDDYWTDPYKLQKQVDFLEANPDYGMVHTDFDQYNLKTGVLTKSIIRSLGQKLKYQQDPNFVKWSTMGKTRIITCTLCFRRSVYEKYIDINDFANPLFIRSGDLVIFATISHHSKVKYIDESTAYKRNLLESASQSQDYKRNIDFIIGISNANEFFAKKYNVPMKYIKPAQKKAAKKIIRAAVVNQDLKMFNMGLNFKKVKHSFIQQIIYKLIYKLYPYVPGVKFQKFILVRLFKKMVKI